jgi:hypothetical protein
MWILWCFQNWYLKKAYLKAKIEELETNSKIKNVRDLYRGINAGNFLFLDQLQNQLAS